MREIKFRVWDTVLSKFFDGDILNDYNLGDFLNDDRYIVTQYTGLKDKNGREIYDGDITIDGYGTVTVIENDGFQWLERIVRLRDRHISKEILIMTKANAFRCEVIGNIYENPELLEGE